MPSLAQRTTARLALAVLLAGFVVQLGVSRLIHQEPWPALAAPTFGGAVPAGGLVHSSEPVMVVTFRDGSTATYNHRQIMDDSRVLKFSAYEQAFGQDSTRIHDRAVTVWLEDRLEKLSGGRAPVSVVLQERDVVRHADGTGKPVVTVESSRTLDLVKDYSDD